MYVEGFNTIIADLGDKLSSEQYQICAETEKLLLNGITWGKVELKTDLVTECYGTGTNIPDAPLYS